MTLIASLKVPHHKQERDVSCVPASVRMVLACYGRTHSEDELQQVLGIGPRGATARNIEKIASLGFEVEIKFSTESELATALLSGTPPIVFLNTGSLDYWSTDCAHVAVVVGMDLTTVFLNDPYFDAAPQQTSLAGFQAAWAANEYLTAFIRPKP